MKELPTYQPEFEEYIRQGEPGKKERAQIWRTAIGLQQVDGLQTSEYLKETVRRNIEGEITMDEVQRLIKAYYASKTNHSPSDEEMEEADQVTSNYKNAKLGIDYTPVYLERFFRNLLLGEHWELKSRYLVINPPAEYDVQPRNDSDTLSNDRQNDRQNDSKNSKQTKAVKRQQRLRELIQTDRFQSAEELAQKLNVSIVTIYRDLKVLHISWFGPSKKGHWTFEAL